MTSSRPLLSLSALLLAGAFAGCDAESPDVEQADANRVGAEPAEADPVEAEPAEAEPAEAEPAEADLVDAVPVDARVVGHVDLDALTSAPWLADAMKDATLAMDAMLGPCADVLRQADSVTFGAKEDAFEAYVEGSFDAAAANACGDRIDAEVARHASRLDEHPKPEAVLLADGVLVVFGGALTPSRDRLEGLRAADPSPGEPLWIMASMASEDRPVEQVKAWANPGKGLRAHAEVVFTDEQQAAEIYGKANLGLAAMSMSDEVGDLASAVSLSSSGTTMSANIELTDEQMKTVVAKAEARHHAHHAHFRHAHEGSGVRVELDAD